LLCAPVAAKAAIGFQEQLVPEPGGRRLQAAFWYPTDAKPRDMKLGFADQLVAHKGHVMGAHLPLIVISPGTMGSWEDNADLAAALAAAGFIVASMTCDEFGPNWMLIPADRTRQLHGLVDYALTSWPGRSHIDRKRIGAFGFSLGGFTVLVAIGGKPDVARIAPHCRAVPAEWACAAEAAHHLDLMQHPPPASAWVADPRIRSAVVAAPAMGYIFGKMGLAGVTVPVQLWQPAQDNALKDAPGAPVLAQDLPVKPEWHVVQGADHGDFSGLCSRAAEAAAPGMCRGTPGFDRRAFHAVFNQAVVRFFRESLQLPRP
jgi:predicted dienelactone hydrolase